MARNTQEILDEMGRCWTRRSVIETEIQLLQAEKLRNEGEGERVGELLGLWEKIDSAKSKLLQDFFNGK